MTTAVSIFDRHMSLKELVEYKNNLEKQVVETGETLPDEVLELSQVASQLLAGKIDQAVRFKQGLEAHIEDCQAQIVYLKKMADLTEKLMKEAVSISGSNRLDGKTYSLKVQNNSRATTVIDDPNKVPKSFFKVTFTYSSEYGEGGILYWVRALLGRMVQFKKDLVEAEQNADIFYRMDLTPEERKQVEQYFKMEVSKSLVEQALKKDPNSVPGAHLEKGTHLRMDKAKTREVEHER